MNDKKITLEIEQLEERIAPGFAPGILLALPLGLSQADNSFTVAGPVVSGLWTGQASQGNGSFC